MDVWSHVIDLCGPQRMKKKIELRQINENNRRESNQSGRSGEISVFPLTKLIMDVPGLSPD
jgi:predicted amino acid racemase